MSCATKWHLAWPCLPVFEVETSMTLHGVALDHDVAALADLARLERVGLRRTGIGGLERL